MKNLFLASSIDYVAEDIAKRIGKKNLSLIFINTAAEVKAGDKQWLKDDRQALVDAGFRVTDYTITGKNRSQVESDLKKFDIIFFSGGNNFYLLQQLQQSESLDIIRNFIRQGKIYIGSSAGSIIAGPDISPTKKLDDDLKAPLIKDYKALNLVNFTVFPHWGSKDFKDLYMKHRLQHAYSSNYKIILLTDYQYIEVVGDTYRIHDAKNT